MRTRISLSDSASLAFGFSHKLLSGTLNCRTDYDKEGCPIIEVEYSDRYFTTATMNHLRLALYGHRLSVLEMTDAETDPESQWSRSELRKVKAFAITHFHRREILIATFEVHRDYLDGDSAEGWTRWQIRNVRIRLDDRDVEIVSHERGSDPEPIWGVRIGHS